MFTDHSRFLPQIAEYEGGFETYMIVFKYVAYNISTHLILSWCRRTKNIKRHYTILARGRRKGRLMALKEVKEVIAAKIR